MKKEDVRKQVGLNLKKARLSKNLSQEDIAKMINTKQTVYSRYENAKLELDYQKIIFICQLLDIEPNDLFENCL